MTTLVQARLEGEAYGLRRAAWWHEDHAEKLRKRIEAARGLPNERELCEAHNRHLAFAAEFHKRADEITLGETP